MAKQEYEIYADYSKGIIADSRYLELFFCNLLTDKKTPLRNRDLLLNRII